jgi:hypothetical protein
MKKSKRMLDAAERDYQPRDIGQKFRPPAHQAQSRFKLA